MTQVMRAKAEIVTEVIEGRSVSFDIGRLIKSDDLYFNATEIAKGFGREVRKWLAISETKEYIEVLNSLPTAVKDIELVIIKRGKFGGTWLHKDLAIAFTRWLNIRFSVLCDIAIKKLIENAHTKRDARLEAKTGYRPLTDAIQENHETPMFYHFTNEANLLNKIVTGLTAKQFKEKYKVENVRDHLKPIQLKALAELQLANTTFINFGLDFDDRKSRLTEHYVTKLLPKLVIQENEPTMTLLTPQKIA